MDILTGVVRDYAWGDLTAIAQILGHEPKGTPEAEYWLGAHQSAPSDLGHSGKQLDQLVADDPAATVGSGVFSRFGSLPFLLKILAAAQPLSIQAHPSLAQAQAGFEREDKAGKGVGEPDRNYRDRNHKPELICALTSFEAKCGFRPIDECVDICGLIGGPDFTELQAILEKSGTASESLAQAVTWLLRLPADRASSMAAWTTVRAAQLLADKTAGTQKFETEWVWTEKISLAFPGDVGVVVALLLNHVSLAPGQAIFLAAGNLHSYLEGVGIELMANSDNVLRGGLTPKHVDVDELLSVVNFEPGAAPVQTAASALHVFESPVPEFALTRLDSTANPLESVVFSPVGPEIVLVTSGKIALESDDQVVELDTGSAAFVAYQDGDYRVVDQAPGHTVAWRATVGSEFC